MFLLSLFTNKNSYNTQIIQCVNDTIFIKQFPRYPVFGTGSGTLEPVPWNRFLRQITSSQPTISEGQPDSWEGGPRVNMPTHANRLSYKHNALSFNYFNWLVIMYNNWIKTCYYLLLPFYMHNKRKTIVLSNKPKELYCWHRWQRPSPKQSQNFCPCSRHTYAWPRFGGNWTWVWG